MASSVKPPVVPITVAYGDGIGPEIMEIVLKILQRAKARISVETVKIGEECYLKGYTSGIPDDAWQIIRKNRVFLKSPITTPQGGGYKSLNVTIRKGLSLYANIRPCVSYEPYISTPYKHIDVTIVRENEEDLYAGVEHRQTNNIYQALKLISRTGCENIVRYAFEYARQNKRKKITCMSKDNIMKFCDGVFHKIFDQIAAEYTDIEHDHMIIDIGAARLATSPEKFDVIVTQNLYGDIISDIIAEMTGSVGLAGSGNIGKKYAMFEAIHGSAPTLIGENRANPTALLLSAIMMLAHIGDGTTATLIHNALLHTIESGYCTPDVADNNPNMKKGLKSHEFGDMIIAHLGEEPKKLQPAPKYADDYTFNGIAEPTSPTEKAVWKPVTTEVKELVGVDIMVDTVWNGADLGDYIIKITNQLKSGLRLVFISHKGFKIYPTSYAHTYSSDHWRLRFMKPDESLVSHWDIIEVLQVLQQNNIGSVKTENLYTFDGVQGFSLAQGQ